MSDEYSIRRLCLPDDATEENAAAIARLAAQLNPTNEPLSDLAWLETMLKPETTYLLVAQKEGAIVGDAHHMRLRSPERLEGARRGRRDRPGASGKRDCEKSFQRSIPHPGKERVENPSAHLPPVARRSKPYVPEARVRTRNNKRISPFSLSVRAGPAPSDAGPFYSCAWSVLRRFSSSRLYGWKRKLKGARSGHGFQ